MEVFIHMSHIVNMLNKRQETDVRRSKGVCDIFGQTLSQATSHHMTLYQSKKHEVKQK
jgi:hypothetical protein